MKIRSRKRIEKGTSWKRVRDKEKIEEGRRGEKGGISGGYKRGKREERTGRRATEEGKGEQRGAGKEIVF